MADINGFSFTGRLGADAKVNTTPNGKTYMELSVANTTGFGDYKKTNWFKVKQWGERVNNIAGIFKKGALVGGTGELNINTWQGQDNAEHTSVEITCQNVQILSSKKDTAESDSTTEPVPEDAVF